MITAGSLQGRVAIVTGASAGLGAGIARELAARGAQVLVCSRSEERLRAMIAGSPHAANLSPLAADVTAPAAAAQLVAAAREIFGHLDILVCNAGGPPPMDFAEAEDPEWAAAYNLIVLAPLRLIRAALPFLCASGSGRIVILSSVSAWRPVPRLVLSNTLRPALSGLARHLAVELGPAGILVNAVSPGFFDTERAREVQEAIAEQNGTSAINTRIEITMQIPLRRQGDPAELGHLVAFLVSAENSYVTGQTIVADGGWLQV